ncbi:MAG: CopG family transcriptional regulator [Burkholderiales bacterium]
MTMIQIELPDATAQAARDAGLLTPQALDRLLNDAIKRQQAADSLQEEERRRLTLEALADVDAHQVIDHQAVQAWAASLSTDAPLNLPQPR